MRRAVEVAHAHRHLGVLVEVAEVQDRIWDESALDEAEQGARGVKGLLAGDESLADADDTPNDHLDRDPDIRPELLRDHLRRYFCREETEVEDHYAVVVLVCRKSEVLRHVVGEGLRDVASIELQR